MGIPRGMEMMVQSLIKMLGLDPNLMMSIVEDIRKSLHSASTDMATIRRQNSAIMAHLGIAEPTESKADERNEQLEQRTGSGSVNGAAGGPRH
jgi:hypothetical protein